MSGVIHLWPQTPIEENGQWKVAFLLELPNREKIEAWYLLEPSLQDLVLESCDPFILPSIYLAMQNGADLNVHGQASPSLLRNLDELMLVWKMWRPEKYAKIEISAEDENELQLPRREKALLTYSGGVDSCYSYWQNRHGLAGRGSFTDLDGLMIHGFDIRLNQPEVYQRILTTQRKILERQGSSLFTLTTNLKKIGYYFEDAQSAMLASCMMLFTKVYLTGLIAASNTYPNPHLPWGSNPLVDPFYSSSAFKVIHDETRGRIEKIRVISGWNEAVRHLRVCLRGKERDVNCGKCEKCVRTILEFRLLGLGLPECFSEDVSDIDILKIQYAHSDRLHYYAEMIEMAKERNLHGSWVNAIKTSYQINRAYRILRTPFKGQFD